MLSKLFISLVLSICLPAVICTDVTPNDWSTINAVVNLASQRSPGKIFIASDFNGVLVDKVKGTAVTKDTMAPICEGVIHPLAERIDVNFNVVSSKPIGMLRELMQYHPNVGASAEHNMENFKPSDKQTSYPTTFTRAISEEFFGHLTGWVKDMPAWSVKPQEHHFSANYQYPKKMNVQTAKELLNEAINAVRQHMKIQNKYHFDIVEDQNKRQLGVLSTLRGKGNFVRQNMDHSYSFGIALGDKAADVPMHEAMVAKRGVGIIVGSGVKNGEYFHLSGPAAVHKLFEELTALPVVKPTSRRGFPWKQPKSS